MNESIRARLSSYLELLALHRGEAREAYDRVGATYDDFVAVWDKHIAAPALAHFNRIVEQRIKPGAHVLDAGAGTGERTRVLLEHAEPGEIIALDASEVMLEVAASKVDDPRVRFMKGDIAELPFEDDTFDAVASTWVVEILDEPRRAVEEFVRVIKPDGFAVYAFCSLPEGAAGKVLKYVIGRATSHDNPLTHLLTEEERPFHECQYSSLQQFAGGLTTVATVGKCCSIMDSELPCRFEITT